MADLRFEKLPPEVQDHLRDLDFETAKSLAIGARRARDLAKEREYPADPVAAVNAIHDIRFPDTEIAVDDPLALALATMALANLALTSPEFTCHEGRALIEVMGVAETALRTWSRRNDEVTARLRAVTHPSK